MNPTNDNAQSDVPDNVVGNDIPAAASADSDSNGTILAAERNVSRETSAELTEALETITRLTERLELLEGKLSAQYTSTSQSPEMSEGESYVFGPTSLTSRILADNGIKEEM